MCISRSQRKKNMPNFKAIGYKDNKGPGKKLMK